MKKLLALVLALVMTLSLCVTSNAAYADAADIDYTEAVDVMSAIGVLEGADGKFNPDGILTREQAAKIIAYMLLGKTAADSLSTAAAPFTDVAADRWSAGAIAYCNSENIIAGKGNGTFGPTEELTGYAFAKMCLVALGYDPNVEGLVGKDWSISTAKVALSAGLNKSLDSLVMSKPITREQAAQMAFNTEKATMVEYQGGTNITTSDGTRVVSGGTRNYVARVGTSFANYGDGDVTNLQFCERYAGNLKLTTPADADGRPSNHWVWKSTVVGDYASKPFLSYNDSVKESKVKADLSAYNLSAVSAYYINGALDGTASTAAAGVTEANVDTEAEIAGISGKGTIIEFYADSANRVTRVAKITPVLAKVTAINSAKKTVTLVPAGGGAAFATITEADKLYETASKLSVDDYVVVTFTDVATPNADVVTSITKPNVVSGTVSSKNTANESAIVGGTTYYATATYGAGNAFTTALATLSTQVYTLYTDPATGYVLFAEAGESATLNYAYAFGYSAGGNAKDGLTYFVHVAKPDGTVEWLQFSKYDGTAMSKSSAVTKITTDGITGVGTTALIITYAELDDGTYDIVKATNNTDTSVNITKNSTTMTSSGVLVNNKTVFMFPKSDDTFAVYTGIKNLPGDYTGAATVANVADAKYASLVVVTGATKTADSADIMLILSGGVGNVTHIGTTDYFTYSALVNGETKTVYCEESTSYVVGHFYNAATYVNEDDAILTPDAGVNEVGTKVVADAALTPGTTYFAFDADADNNGTASLQGVTRNGDILNVDGTTYAISDEGFKVFFIDTGDSNAVTSDIALGQTNLFGTDPAVMTTFDKAGLATAIYIVGTLA